MALIDSNEGMSSLEFSHWQAFAALGIVLVIAEIFVPGFVLLPIGLGFLVTAVASAFISDWAWLLVFCAVAQLGIWFFFQKVLSRRTRESAAPTNAEGMIGAECVVTEVIRPGQLGYVKLYGDTWQAGSAAVESLEPGRKVKIIAIDGNKVRVTPL